MAYNQQYIRKKESILELLSHNLFQSNWIEGFGCVVLLRKKAISDLLVWLNTVIQNDTDFTPIMRKQRFIIFLFKSTT